MTLVSVTNRSYLPSYIVHNIEQIEIDRIEFEVTFYELKNNYDYGKIARCDVLLFFFVNTGCILFCPKARRLYLFVTAKRPYNMH